MAEDKLQRVTVTVTLAIDVSPAWGDDCTVGQAGAQASEEAMTTLRHVLYPDAGCLSEAFIARLRERVKIVRGSVRTRLHVVTDAAGKIWTE